MPENIRTENYGGYQHRNVTAEEYKGADAGDPVVERQKEHVTEHVSDFNAPPVVEFTNVCMEFHPQGPVRPEGPIVMDLVTRDAEGNPRKQVFQVMEGAISRLRVDFKVHNNACIGLKCVTGVKALNSMFKEEEVFGAYRADPTTVVTEYTSWFEQPKGFFYRGKYGGKLYFSDVQHIVHMQLDLEIKIAKSWS